MAARIEQFAAMLPLKVSVAIRSAPSLPEEEKSNEAATLR
jgi:hypothetical protein